MSRIFYYCNYSLRFLWSLSLLAVTKLCCSIILIHTHTHTHTAAVCTVARAMVQWRRPDSLGWKCDYKINTTRNNRNHIYETTLFNLSQQCLDSVKVDSAVQHHHPAVWHQINKQKSSFPSCKMALIQWVALKIHSNCRYIALHKHISEHNRVDLASIWHVDSYRK